ncbi:MAG: sigma 54-interacting transcriptional regulator [Candidatus Eisenbacteria bacterium]|uniref:Sigma 54-interacting transcriptional regulator n=1 Tax=Eiseniibacteriota bacterium TaxID=2212470 RepID=A0A849SPZ9_UNCEI|nr:sigma 54-interacting transcriptional regulator [Candidatus Eisenbacteria bacterium]
MMLGESAAWKDVLETLPRIAASELPVLLLGESGTGKELVARAIHEGSERFASAFVAHNCGATPDSLIESELFGHARGAYTGAVGERPGLFEVAHQGTLFLDEIGDASALLQMKLLRVLQEGETRRVGDTRVRRVDVRIVSATHRGLDQAVGRSEFRADLYFRLNAVTLRLPPLRERGHDILLLARHFLARAAGRSEAPALEPSLAEHLLRWSWPGNVRELANACAYAVRVSGARERVAEQHWPAPALPEHRSRNGLHAETRALEERRLLETLERTRGNKSRAARALGLSRQGLLKKLRRYGLLAADSAACLDAPEGAS